MGPATITLLRGRLDGGGHFYFSIVTQWRQVVNAVNSWDLATLALPLTLACNLLVFHIVCVCISLRFAARFYLKSIEIRRKAVEYKLKSFEICLLSNGSGVRISSGSPRRRGLHIVRDDFFTKVISHAFRRSSSPNRTRCTGLRFGFGCKPESSGIYSVAMLHVV